MISFLCSCDIKINHWSCKKCAITQKNRTDPDSRPSARFSWIIQICFIWSVSSKISMMSFRSVMSRRYISLTNELSVMFRSCLIRYMLEIGKAKLLNRSSWESLFSFIFRKKGLKMNFGISSGSSYWNIRRRIRLISDLIPPVSLFWSNKKNTWILYVFSLESLLPEQGNSQISIFWYLP